MQTYKLRITPWHADGVHRVIEFRGGNTLHDLHDAIQRAFALDDDHLYAFFMNHALWSKEFAFGGPGSDFPDASRKRLADLGLKANKRFLYLFDFGDELTFEVRVAGFGEETRGESYPRVVESVGDAPPQYEDEYAEHDHSHEAVSVDAATLELLSRAKRFVDAYDAMFAESLEGLGPASELDDAEGLDPSFEDDDVDEDDRFDEDAEEDEALDFPDEDELLAGLPADRILEEAALVEQIVASARGDTGRMHHLTAHAIDGDVSGWMLSLPQRLTDAGHPARAADIVQVLLPAFPSDSLRFMLPLLLAAAGRKDEALGAVRRNLDEFPGESDMLGLSGAAYVELGDDANGEKCFREALESCGSNRSRREGLVEGLCEILERQGRAAEIAALERREEAYRARWSGGGSGLPFVRTEEKVGRNDPCPCGSGKKYKKCCGAA
jgi:tetratricopeptide (TPR) repeat protein